LITQIDRLKRRDFVKIGLAFSGACTFAQAQNAQANSAATEVVANADFLTTDMVAASKQKAVAVINLAGRQRMLSQRMAKNYLLIANGILPKELPASIDADRKTYTEAMTAISAGPEADAKEAKGVAELSTIYKRFDVLVADRSDAGMAKPNLVTLATLSEQLLNAAHEVTLMFEDVVSAKA
jgi:Type IV pili methyl-accepting chemotaxis transducer N-term